LDYSTAQSIRDLLDDLARRRDDIVFARANQYLGSDMDRHDITAALDETRIFATLYEAIAVVRILGLCRAIGGAGLNQGGVHESRSRRC
jgi:hypothetical protein